MTNSVITNITPTGVAARRTVSSNLSVISDRFKRLLLLGNGSTPASMTNPTSAKGLSVN